MATTTHRAIQGNICATETSNEIPSNSITTNTTNLINININNSGNVTSVASGENHQINNTNAIR